MISTFFFLSLRFQINNGAGSRCEMLTFSLSGRELLPLAGILSCTSEKVFPSAFLPVEGFKGENTLKTGDASPAEPGGIFIYGFRFPHSSLNKHVPYYCVFPFILSLSLLLEQGCSAPSLEPGEDQTPLLH